MLYIFFHAGLHTDKHGVLHTRLFYRYKKTDKHRKKPTIEFHVWRPPTAVDYMKLVTDIGKKDTSRRSREEAISPHCGKGWRIFCDETVLDPNNKLFSICRCNGEFDYRIKSSDGANALPSRSAEHMITAQHRTFDWSSSTYYAYKSNPEGFIQSLVEETKRTQPAVVQVTSFDLGAEFDVNEAKGIELPIAARVCITGVTFGRGVLTITCTKKVEKQHLMDILGAVGRKLMRYEGDRSEVCSTTSSSSASVIMNAVWFQQIMTYEAHTNFCYTGENVLEKLSESKNLLKKFKPIFNTSRMAKLGETGRKMWYDFLDNSDFRNDSNIVGLRAYCISLFHIADNLVIEKALDNDGLWLPAPPSLIYTTQNAERQLHHTDEDEFQKSRTKMDPLPDGTPRRSISELRKGYSISIWAPLDSGGKELILYPEFQPVKYFDEPPSSGEGNYPTEEQTFILDAKFGDVVFFRTTGCWHSGAGGKGRPTLVYHQYHDRRRFKDIPTTSADGEREENESLRRIEGTTFSNCKNKYIEQSKHSKSGGRGKKRKRGE